MIISSYSCHTTSPNDKSCIFVIDDAIKSIVLNKRISALTKNLWCCYGDSIAKLDSKYQVIKSYSNEYFNQLHSVFVDGDIHYVCSTGLDLLLKLKNGKIMDSWNPDHGNDLSWLEPKDYRGINYHSLGINKHHLNHVFKCNGKVYVCCGKSHKYYELNNNLTVNNFVDMKLKYDGSNILHDGFKIGDHVFFTETTGHIHKWNVKTGEVISKNIEVKWIRGLTKTNEGFYVGSSAVDCKACVVHLNNNLNVLDKLFIKKSPIDNPQLYSIIC